MTVEAFRPAESFTRRFAERLRPALWRSGEVVRLFPGMRRRPASPGLPDTLGRLGSLEVRLARTPKDVRKAQRLRYRVFYEEGGATPTAALKLVRRDVDAFDALCDHLLVIDHAAKGKFGKLKSRVVGTYRLLRQEVADRHGGFYSAGEFAVEAFIAAHPNERVLELGRSCVLRSHRGKRTVELLWRGLWAYVLHHRVDVLLGCASLDGLDPGRLALPLSFLHHHAPSPPERRVRARPERFVTMNRLPREQIDVKAAMKSLPPLVKAYLRVGATFGEGAVIDRQFGTTDVFVLMRVADIAARYVEHYGGSGLSEAA